MRCDVRSCDNNFIVYKFVIAVCTRFSASHIRIAIVPSGQQAVKRPSKRRRYYIFAIPLDWTIIIMYGLLLLLRVYYVFLLLHMHIILYNIYWKTEMLTTLGPVLFYTHSEHTYNTYHLFIYIDNDFFLSK